MIYLVTYDPDTLEIAGRVRISNHAHRTLYPDSIEVTEEEFYAEPELHQMVVDGKLRAVYLYDDLKVEDIR